MATLQWRDSKDAYKPIKRPLRDFLQETQHRIVEPSYRNIESLYRELSTNQMSVFVQQKAVDQLIQHLSIDPYNETGGVLVGDGYFCPERQTHYTEIVGSIPASYTIGNRVHFQFTPECWQGILRTQKQDFPTTTIVGWYHSHPGHGIFLSGTDLNTQRLSFKQIWQIAVVYDSLRPEIGFFYGADGIKLDAIYLQDISKAAASQPKPQQLEWRQPGSQLPTLPISASEQLHNSAASDEEELQNRSTQSIRHTEIRGQDHNIIIFLIMFLMLSLLILLIISSRSQSYPQKPQPSQSQPALPQPAQSEFPN